jgi:hypothetical protein
MYGKQDEAGGDNDKKDPDSICYHFATQPLGTKREEAGSDAKGRPDYPNKYSHLGKGWYW